MENTDSIRALVSVHDVMPETLESVQTVLQRLAAARISAATLLVVPGADWTPPAIDVLHDFERRGYVLAGHGWRHRASHIGGLRHRIHAALISRQVAEHMALDAKGIVALMKRCHAWFGEQGLQSPSLYVPPAWAMGRIERSALADLPFLQYELFSGILSAQTGRLHPMPLLGYEADTGSRTPALRLWNRINRHRAKTAGWIRIGIHPYDIRLRLAEDLEEDLRRFPIHADYGAVDAEGDQRYRLVTSARSPCAANSTMSNTRSKPL
ncbi:polysaccharide deacetylase family protein [Imhoffiella purpurea]|uniref:Deacetylase n=1 Tax=Imhoffiella purpurea TaxID=1249627 RepID=W9V496_9GAMM|nr:polysaccharide deacetylase family protein [Imhoffiella purpurea]EXJ11766.1 hypothetical protein D779_0140 [Imhoffiella purpurea]